MFTCAKIRGGKTYLKSHLAANDYYNENEHVTGRWTGEAAKTLGLHDQPINAKDRTFEALRKNLHPLTGEKLTPNRDEKSVRFFDFQVAPHKSVSVMAVVMGDNRLYEAHDRAAAVAFAELERFAGFRSGKSRDTEISGNVCAAAFRHDASRSLDPQIHTHFVTVNATYDAINQRWLALDTCEMFKAIRYAGKVYQNALAQECRRLGYQIEAVRNGKRKIEGFQIAGVSKEIQELYSKRRAEVEAGIERFKLEKGRMPTTQEIHVITRDTRNVKLHEITTEEVREKQRKQLSPEEFENLDALKNRSIKAAMQRMKSGVGLRMDSAAKHLQMAAEHIFERKSVVKGHEALAEALNRGLGFINLDALKRSINRSGIIQLAKNENNPLLSGEWASRRGFRLERESIEFVNQTQNCCKPLGETENVKFDFKSNEQRRVVLETLNNRDKVYAIRGCAGAGKTTALSEIRKGLEAAGREAIYLAPTAGAVEVLRKDGFTNATTIDYFLLKGKKELPNDAVIIIDESSLKSTELGAAVFTAARNARLLLIGDTRQHVSVEAGDFLRVLEQHSRLHYSELKDIQRQQGAEYNAAIRTLSEGRTADGIKQLDDLGWIEEGKDKYIQKAAAAFFEATDEGNDLDRVIAVSPTWTEIFQFTDAIRQGLKERDLLGKESAALSVYDQIDWTEAERKTIENYQPGMFLTFQGKKDSAIGGKTLEIERIENGLLRLKGYNRFIDVREKAGKFSVSQARTIELSEGDKILIRRNHKESGLVNGDILTIDKINGDGSIKTREGKDIPADYRHFTHGYVVTSHKSQGHTRKEVVIAAENLDAKSAYVACSRGKEQAHIFTPDKQNLFNKLGVPTDRAAVADIIAKHRNGVWDMDEADARKAAKDGRTYNSNNERRRHEML